MAEVSYLYRTRTFLNLMKFEYDQNSGSFYKFAPHILVGEPGFEPGTPCSQSMCAASCATPRKISVLVQNNNNRIKLYYTVTLILDNIPLVVIPACFNNLSFPQSFSGNPEGFFLWIARSSRAMTIR